MPLYSMHMILHMTLQDKKTIKYRTKEKLCYRLVALCCILQAAVSSVVNCIHHIYNTLICVEIKILIVLKI